MKLVLDTSFFIAALLNSSGPTAQTLVKLLKGKHQVFYSEALIKEIKAVANRKKIEARYIATVVLLLRTYGVKVVPGRIRDDSPDPKDDFLIALVRKCKPDYVVSGNHEDLLAAEKEGAVLLSIREATKRFG
ncbi:MAG: putative toxin-antitoxin system toxin component, PIN family [Thermaceae bacterium]|nr:putative toxin-antitoxin system toxin component, PIN family [Thermaceae bacterium]